MRASGQQVKTRPARLRTEVYSESLHAVLTLSCGRAKCQCSITTVTIIVYVNAESRNNQIVI